LIAQILYGAGLRLMELARLRVKDIDFGSELIFVRSTKGDKDRSTILPETREPVSGFYSLFYLRLLNNDLSNHRQDLILIYRIPLFEVYGLDSSIHR
ncbi:MAG: integron integrase, partial [bacterium]